MYRLMYRGSGRRFAEITPSKKKKKTEEGENKREREKRGRNLCRDVDRKKSKDGEVRANF